jgi:hypothetical protein
MKIVDKYGMVNLIVEYGSIDMEERDFIKLKGKKTE